MTSPPVQEAGYDESASITQDECDLTWLKPEDMAALQSIAVDHELSSSLQNTPKSERASFQASRIKTLPQGSKPVKFIGEGSANAVFQVAVPSDGRNPREFQGLLLRLAKAPSLRHSPAYDYLKQQKHFHTAIRPRLGKYAVHQELVILRGSGIVGELNHLLREKHQQRKDKFKDSYINESDWGFLVEDMRPADPTKFALVEFKPKWLLQSPSAPKDASRCRQCALNLQLFLEHPASCHKILPYRKLCPLSLQPDAHELTASPFRIAPQLSQEKEHENYYAGWVRSVTQHDAIRLLRKQQALLDQVGPLDVDPSDPNFPLAMTLRDCTCFAHIPRPGASADLQQPPPPTITASATIKFGDLDWKDPEQKMERWRTTEASLIDGGFYSAAAVQLDRSVYPVPTLCALEHNRRCDEGATRIRLSGPGHAASDSVAGTSNNRVYNLVLEQPELLRPALEEWQDLVL